MMGDYCIYCNGILFGLICDNNFYLKVTEPGKSLLKEVILRPPYEGAKDYFYISDVDDRYYLSELIKASLPALSKHFGNLSMIDIVYARPEEDSAVLVIVTVGYIDGTPENQANLLDKMECYLKHTYSDEFKQQYPYSFIYLDVTFDQKPHTLITDLLYKCTNWCKEHGVILRIKIGDEYYSFS